MITVWALLLISFIINMAYLFVSYNFLYDIRLGDNINRVENYYIVKENNKLFSEYFEKTDEDIYTQQYGMVPPWKFINIWYYTVNNPGVTFTWKVCFNLNCYEITWHQIININWWYNIYVWSENWEPFLITGINYENTYTCSGGIYKQMINAYNLTREYTIFTSTNPSDLNLTKTQNTNNVHLTWTIPWNNSILDKYIINLYAGEFLYIKTWANNLCTNISNCEINVPLSWNYIIFTWENIIYSWYNVIFSWEQAFLSWTNTELTWDIIVLTWWSQFGTWLLAPLTWYEFLLKVEWKWILKDCSLLANP